MNAAASDIFGCAASLARNPNRCAALDRHVATLPADQQADPGRHYKAVPADHDAKFWHDNAINRLAGEFPHDDVAGQPSFIAHADPQWLLVAVDRQPSGRHRPKAPHLPLLEVRGLGPSAAMAEGAVLPVAPLATDVLGAGPGPQPPPRSGHERGPRGNGAGRLRDHRVPRQSHDR
ncbi:beta-1,3-glucanase family protein [Streptomyces brasiliensis]|uniref:GH64 domain-containing protein n=1 Tax=Streptomyces brasiliensis TaxID=1954 RepID=A0A917KVT8_9ACTN|nr:hypothetical protein GCM10010121_043110 [Streptomyces brasiliensis]